MDDVEGEVSRSGEGDDIVAVPDVGKRLRLLAIGTDRAPSSISRIDTSCDLES